MLPPPGTVSRRTFVLGSGAGLAGLLLAACGDDDGDDGGDDGNGGATDTTPAGSGQLVLGEAFDRNALLVVGAAQRAPYLLFEPSGGLVAVDDAPAAIAFTFRPEGGGEALGPISTARRGDGIDRPYYPVVATFPSPGIWEVTADLGDGRTLESLVLVNPTTTLPQIGDPLPVAPTPTEADPLGVGDLCTADPPCSLHATSLDVARGAGRPVAVLLSTPAYCATGICGPVLDLLVDAADGRDDLDAIHIEVYTESTADGPGTPSPLVVDTFSLTYEPALFVADASGTITARLDNIFDDEELSEALASAVPPG